MFLNTKHQLYTSLIQDPAKNLRVLIYKFLKTLATHCMHHPFKTAFTHTCVIFLGVATM